MDDFNYDKKKWILVIGNEGHGISENSKKYIQHFLSIPSSGSGNSLNAAVAGSILIHHLISL
jgi:TrmH family RNA methyltransferase